MNIKVGPKTDFKAGEKGILDFDFYGPDSEGRPGKAKVAGKGETVTVLRVRPYRGKGIWKEQIEVETASGAVLSVLPFALLRSPK